MDGKKSFLERHEWIGIIVDWVIFLGPTIVLGGILSQVLKDGDYFIPILALLVVPIFSFYVNILRPSKSERLKEWKDYFSGNGFFALIIWGCHSTIGLYGKYRLVQGPVWKMELKKAVPIFVLEGVVTGLWFLLAYISKKYNWQTTKSQPTDEQEVAIIETATKNRKKG
ncbi:Uncharacterised protein [Streptococcus criceti]|uniref:Uncharacterized protein n=1 Tax=Streptococcus criceti HS-6 TaxID=873449 RepID=G5JMR9_STRCG|nr:hypothetical protein [Streptococcus criceti]EHI74734.1 hypothetical protein STRCR_0033 [Streptococcus criceti HS-6]SUN41550.1 Uncharacterised protein [Streptococcus criceti]